MVGMSVAAGILGGAALAVVAAGLGGQAGHLYEASWAAAVAATTGWPALALLVIVASYVGVGLIGWLAMPNRQLADPAPYVPDDKNALGICCSGGGVRAASFSLGVLQQLDAQALYDQARWLAGVSGGSYMAGAWSIARYKLPPLSEHPEHNPNGPSAPPRPWTAALTDDPENRGESPEVGYLRRHLGYIFGRQGGLGGALATLIVGLGINVLALAVFWWLITRVLGWVIGSWAITDAAHLPGHELHYTLSSRYLQPVLIWAAATGALIFVWVLLRRLASLGRRFTAPPVIMGVWKAGLGALAITILLATVLIAAPAAAAAIPNLIANYDQTLRSIETILLAGLGATVFKVISKPLNRHLSHLGGVLVLLLAILFGSEVAANGARAGVAGDAGEWALVALIFAVAYYVADPDWWSLQPYYRARLRSVYATKRTTDGRVEPLTAAEEPALSDLKCERPELLVCATMNVSGKVATRVGVPAYSFTFSPTNIRYHAAGHTDGASRDFAVDTKRYGRIFRRWDTPPLAVMTAVGMSGAAVSSAMGRFKYGSTHALITLANVRLGMWMPNPAYIDNTLRLPAKPGYPRRRLNYLLKELFRLYDPDDLYLYITDGGHWENLGLVELTRRQCREIFCIDAAGVDPAHFSTIAEAITLAAQECGARIELPYDELRAAADSSKSPFDCTVGVIHYADHSIGVLWYMRSALTATENSRLLAYKEQNPIFPNDPTVDQFFNTERFECYRLLGYDVAQHALELRQNTVRRLRGGESRPNSRALTDEEKRRLDALTPDQTTLLRRILDPDGTPPDQDDIALSRTAT
jgi:hypothetical protein